MFYSKDLFFAMLVLFFSAYRYTFALSLLFILTACSYSENKNIIVLDKSALNCQKTYHLNMPDSLARIANVCGIPLEKLAQFNKIKAPYLIKKGQSIKFPKKYLAQKNLAQKPKTSKDSKKNKLNSRQESAVKKINSLTWIRPVFADVKQVFNRKKSRLGVSFATKLGQKVYAIKDGRVVYSGDKMRTHGKIIIIKHADNFYSSYTKNSEILVADGDFIKGGDVIAITGKDSFYLEMRKQNKPVDPMHYLPK